MLRFDPVLSAIPTALNRSKGRNKRESKWNYYWTAS